MKSRDVKTEMVTYKNRRALRVTDAALAAVGDGDRLVILSKTEFQDGGVEIDLTGEPGPSTEEGARGFVGVAFRRGPWRDLDDVEYATLARVDWFNNRRLLESIGNLPPAELEMMYYRQLDESATAA